MSENYGFTQTMQPTASHPLTFELQHILDNPELLSKVFALQSEIVAESRKRLTAKIEALELQWETARLAGIKARDEFQAHKQGELIVQNNVQNANNKMMAAHRILSSYKNAQVDPYASKQQRQARLETIADSERKVKLAEDAAIVANGCQNAYYGEAQQLAEKWNQAQRAFAEVDSALNSLKEQLADIEAES